MKDHHKMRAWYDGRYWHWNPSKDEWYDERGDCQLGSYLTERGAIFEQCTGLKDKNRTMIYEGDICIHHEYCVVLDGQGVPDKPGKVVYFGASFFVDFGDQAHSVFTEGSAWEIIGNIHENQELLK